MLFHIGQEVCGHADGGCRPELLKFFCCCLVGKVVFIHCVFRHCLKKVSLLASGCGHNAGLTMLGGELLKITTFQRRTLLLFWQGRPDVQHGFIPCRIKQQSWRITLRVCGFFSVGVGSIDLGRVFFQKEPLLSASSNSDVMPWGDRLLNTDVEVNRLWPRYTSIYYTFSVGSLIVNVFFHISRRSTRSSRLIAEMNCF